MASTRLPEVRKPLCQLHDKPERAKNETVVCIPPSWALTPNQQAFIASFAEDEHKKQ